MINFIFSNKLNSYSGWGTLSVNYIQLLKKKNVIIFCNTVNKKIKVLQYPILRDPLTYLKNPILIFLDSYKIIKIIHNTKRLHRNKISAHFLVEPYVLFLFFLNDLFQKKVFYCIGTYSNILASSIKHRFFFKKITLNLTDIIFLSRLTKKKILPKIFISKKCNIQIINPFINIKKKIKKYIKKNKKKNLVLLSVGGIKERKGYHNLISIMNILINKYKFKAKLNIIGSVDESLYYNNLKQQIFHNKLDKFISIKHKVDNNKLNKYYSSSDIFLLLSESKGLHFEGFGIVLLEALACKINVIASRYSGGPDIKFFLKYINVVSPSNHSKIARYIRKYFLNKQRNKTEMNFKDFYLYNEYNKKKLKNFLNRF
jgi:glycosyltransferase involved in cell wall biosynthesis